MRYALTLGLLCLSSTARAENPLEYLKNSTVGRSVDQTALVKATRQLEGLFWAQFIRQKFEHADIEKLLGPPEGYTAFVTGSTCIETLYYRQRGVTVTILDYRTSSGPVHRVEVQSTFGRFLP